eukprot:scaffold2687_cov76-Cyclotella_meneghiniana.AAC.2
MHNGETFSFGLRRRRVQVRSCATHVQDTNPTSCNTVLPTPRNAVLHDVCCLLLALSYVPSVSSADWPRGQHRCYHHHHHRLWLG